MQHSIISLWFKYAFRDRRVAAMMFGLVFGSVLLGPSSVKLVRQLPFLLEGTTVQGKVIDTQIARVSSSGVPLAMIPLFAHGGGGHRPGYVIRYEYTDAVGIRHLGSGRASGAEWSDARRGSPIAVRYLRNDPEKSQLASETWRASMTIPFGIGLAIVAWSIWYASKGMRWAAQQVRLVGWGRAVRGTLTRAEIEHRGTRRKERVCVLEYEYAAPEPMTGKLELCGKLRHNWCSGNRIVVLIDPDKPTNHAADIFDARICDREELIGRSLA